MSPRAVTSDSCRNADASSDRARSNSRLRVRTSSTCDHASIAVRDGALVLLGVIVLDDTGKDVDGVGAVAKVNDGRG